MSPFLESGSIPSFVITGPPAPIFISSATSAEEEAKSLRLLYSEKIYESSEEESDEHYGEVALHF